MRNGSPAPRLVVAVTNPISCVLLRGQLAWAKRQGFEVALVCSPGPLAVETARTEGATLLAVPMKRGLSPVHDLVAVVRLVAVLRRFRPDIVNAGTPKAGLLVTLAAWCCGVPCRIYHLRGLYSDGCAGAARRLMTSLERLSCRLATKVLCDSPSLKSRAEELRLVGPDKAIVLGNGSSNGVDAARFTLTTELRSRAEALRANLAIPPTATVVGFVGRILRDKGIFELLESWGGIRERYPEIHLLLVGPFEEAAAAALVRQIRAADQRVHALGSVGDVAPCYAAMDLLVLPTYREGFGNVLLEAAAMQLPVVATRVTGCVDAVADGSSGMLVPPRNAAALTEAICRYLDDAALRRRHGQAGRERVLRHFDQHAILKSLHGEYIQLLRGRRLPLPATDSGEFPADAVATTISAPSGPVVRL